MSSWIASVIDRSIEYIKSIDKSGGAPDTSNFTDAQNRALHYVLVAGACLTLLGTGSVLLAYLLKYFKKENNDDEDGAKMIFFITLPGFLGSFFWFPWLPERNDAFCLVQASGIQFFELSSLVWSSCIVFIFLRVISKQSIKRASGKFDNKLVYFHLVSWGLPLASVLPCLAFGLYGPTPGPWCWITNPGLRLIIYGVGAIVVFTNVSIYVYLRLKLNKREGYEFITKRFFSFIFASLICQAPSLGNRIQNYIDPTNPIFALYMIQTIFQPIQGFINAVIYGFVDEYFWSTYADLFYFCRPINQLLGGAKSTEHLVVNGVKGQQNNKPPPTEDTYLFVDYGDGDGDDSQRYNFIKHMDGSIN
ncbi:hypothetical protein SAMD00019534_086340 [Acytostelium subglobosum LB1]|uniref:hypothetical protein n=1 Tax=Acytostelium subglobosum LB1 TaxID=1410327 RepID=UPI000644CEE7|nr:hypothetical protein SAMD00019534_086340 [Acytostelium subglobosum LB1]GAM25459.1 hypothetical protein SAMD00019534_086340 [Acytostelium subglobosum LB1]|eukprot:XP_012751445.1 hypothetical protein SAMD00019534_086340 [Acytostelium subglobosum LB1]